MFITVKPALYLVNLSEKDYIRKKNKWLIHRYSGLLSLKQNKKCI